MNEEMFAYERDESFDPNDYQGNAILALHHHMAPAVPGEDEF